MGRLVQDVDLASGALRGVIGPLIRMPISPTAYSGNNFNQGLSTGAVNPDGSASSVALSIAAGPAGSVSSFTQKVQGRVAGIRFLAASPLDVGAAGTPLIDAVIDGVAYGLDHAQLRFDNASAATGRTDTEAAWLIDDTLTDRSHTVTVALQPDATGGFLRKLTLFGYLAEQSRGYIVPPPPAVATVTGQGVALTTTATSISFSYGTAVTALQFYNTDTVARVVTIYGPTGTATADIWAKISISAGGSFTSPFPTPRLMAGWKWLADAAAVVYARTEASRGAI